MWMMPQWISRLLASVEQWYVLASHVLQLKEPGTMEGIWKWYSSSNCILSELNLKENEDKDMTQILPLYGSGVYLWFHVFLHLGFQVPYRCLIVVFFISLQEWIKDCFSFKKITQEKFLCILLLVLTAECGKSLVMYSGMWVFLIFCEITIPDI